MKGYCNEKFRTSYVVLYLQSRFSNWCQVEVQVQHGWETVSWFRYPKYHEHSSAQDYSAYEDNNKRTSSREGKVKHWSIVTSKSEGRRVCTVKSARPMNPVTACGLERRWNRKLWLYWQLAFCLRWILVLGTYSKSLLKWLVNHHESVPYESFSFLHSFVRNLTFIEKWKNTRSTKNKTKSQESNSNYRRYSNPKTQNQDQYHSHRTVKWPTQTKALNTSPNSIPL